LDLVFVHKALTDPLTALPHRAPLLTRLLWLW